MGKIDNEELAALAAKLAGRKSAGEVKGVYLEEVERLVEAGRMKEGEARSLVG